MPSVSTQARTALAILCALRGAIGHALPRLRQPTASGWCACMSSLWVSPAASPALRRGGSWLAHTPTASLSVTSAVASGCGHERGHIEHRVAQALAGRPVPHEGPAERPQRRLPPYAQTLALVRQHDGRRPRLTPRGCTDQTPPSDEGPLWVAYGRSNDIIAPSCLGMRGPDGGPLFASSRWLLYTGCSMYAIDTKYTREFLAIGFAVFHPCGMCILCKCHDSLNSSRSISHNL